MEPVEVQTFFSHCSVKPLYDPPDLRYWTGYFRLVFRAHAILQRLPAARVPEHAGRRALAAGTPDRNPEHGATRRGAGAHRTHHAAAFAGCAGWVAENEVFLMRL